MYLDAHSNLAFLQNYLPKQSKEEVYRIHQEWENAHGGSAKQRPQHHHWQYTPTQPESPGHHRRLRIGYVSADFYNHSVAYFLRPLLQHHNPERVSVYGYMNGPTDDRMTQELKTHCDHWRRIMGKTAEQVADQIQSDQIDILIDLAGHTAGNRLDVFTLKAAPLQMTWLGYPNTTGLTRVIDGLLQGLGNVPVALHRELATVHALPQSSLTECIASMGVILQNPGRSTQGHRHESQFPGAFVLRQQCAGPGVSTARECNTRHYGQGSAARAGKPPDPIGPDQGLRT